MRQYPASSIVPAMFVDFYAPSHYLNQFPRIIRYQLEIVFSDIRIKIENISFKKIYLEKSSEKWQAFCTGLNVLIHKLPNDKSTYQKKNGKQKS